ncbi:MULTISPECIES: hypothetical protein [unclassified Pseudomonas]|uniref:OB-fold protein n=1 Tax=unclassified Pseudomonas TaxID=196821 RepID=UPI00381D7000
MKVLRNGLIAALPMLAMSGCITLEQGLQQVQQATAPAPVTQSLAQICQDVKANKVRANETYRNKTLSVSGKVEMINQGMQPRYRVYMSNGAVEIFAGTDNTSQVSALSVGKTTQVTGVITLVDQDYRACSVTLKNSTF